MFIVTKLIKNTEAFLGASSLGKRFLPHFLTFRKWAQYRQWALRSGLSLSFIDGNVELRKRNRKLIFSRKKMYLFWEAIDYFDEYFDSFETEMRGGFVTLDFSQTRDQTLRFLGVPLLIPGATEGEWTLKAYTKKYMPKAGDIVFDCGAYCGVVTYYLSQLVGPTGRVYAFEPDDSNYQMLLENIKKHNLTNVTPVKKGVYSKSTTVSFSNTSSPLSVIAPTGSAGTTDIEVISLADAYKQFGLTHLDFVKMDIEGAELEVIEGAKKFLQDKEVHFAIASYHRVDGQQTCVTLEKLFAEMGYESETGSPRCLTTWAWKKDIDT